jgi:flagellar protein FliS
MFAPYRSQAAAYRNLQLESSVQQASPHRLVSMLFEGALAAIRQGRTAMEAGDHAAKGQALTRAIRIVDEGLKASLDPAGGDLAQRLSGLYDYIARQLLVASARNDVGLLDQVVALIVPLHEAWLAIDPGRGAAAPRAASGALR